MNTEELKLEIQKCINGADHLDHATDKIMELVAQYVSDIKYPLEERFCLLLDHVSMGNMSEPNYDLETMKRVIDDVQQEHHWNIIKSDLGKLTKQGGTIDDVQKYIDDL